MVPHPHGLKACRYVFNLLFSWFITNNAFIISQLTPIYFIYFQMYGPPPSYPCQKIPGLNALVSTGDSFGDAPGEWGKPPIGEVSYLLKYYVC